MESLALASTASPCARRGFSGASCQSERNGSGYGHSSFFGAKMDMPTRLPCPIAKAVPSLKIEMAITKEKKFSTVKMAKEQLEGCTLIASINYKTFTVKQFQDFRQRLPEGSSLVIMKNSLLEKAIEGTSFEALKPSMSGMNAFLFVHSEEIPAALKPFRDLQKELKLEDNDYTGAVFEGKFYGPDDFKSLETMPTRAELYAKILGQLQAPASNLVGTLQAPARDLVLTLKAHVKNLEEQAGSS